MIQYVKVEEKKLLRVEDVDNREFLTNLVLAMYDELPCAKSKNIG